MAEVRYTLSMTLDEVGALYWSIDPDHATEHYGDSDRGLIAREIETKLGDIIDGTNQQ